MVSPHLQSTLSVYQLVSFALKQEHIEEYVERKGSYSYRIIHVAFDICSTVTAPGIWILCTIGICAHAYKITVNKIYKYVSEEVHFDITLWIFIILVTCLCCLLELKWEVTVSGVASLGIRVLSFLQTTYSWHQNWAITAPSHFVF